MMSLAEEMILGSLIEQPPGIEALKGRNRDILERQRNEF